jgi:alanyl-tRNA synthetase
LFYTNISKISEEEFSKKLNLSKEDKEILRRFRIVADHSRSSIFLIGD